MRKIKLLSLILISLMVLSGAGLVATVANYGVNVNGQPLDATVLNHNGTTYLPIRAVSESLGVPIEWTGSSVEIQTVDVEALKEACVMIECTSSREWSQGSGVFIDYDTVLTAYHVVEGMTDIKIDGTSFKIADYNKQYDIAILIADVRRKPVKIGDSDEINADEPAFIIGYPGGGDINAISAKITHGGPPYMSLNQRAEHGMSGGPIFNSSGELIGIINQNSLGVKMSMGTTINIIREVL